MLKDKGLGRAGIFLTKKWDDKFTNVNSITHTMIVMMALVQGIIISIIWNSAPNCRLNDKQKENFYGKLKLSES